MLYKKIIGYVKSILDGVCGGFRINNYSRIQWEEWSFQGLKSKFFQIFILGYYNFC